MCKYKGSGIESWGMKWKMDITWKLDLHKCWHAYEECR